MSASLSSWRGLVVVICLIGSIMVTGFTGAPPATLAADPAPQAASPTPQACVPPKPGETPKMCSPEPSPTPPPSPMGTPGATPSPMSTPGAAPDCQRLQAAIFTTNADGSQNNGNIYPSKEAVYVNGGPDSASTGVPNATRYYQVTTPGGAALMPVRQFTISGDGSFRVQLAPFDTSPNGEYKVSVSTSPGIPSNDCTKSDNFRVTQEPLPSPGASATPGTAGPSQPTPTTRVNTTVNTATTIAVPTQSATGRPITVLIVTPPSHGTALVGPQNTITYTPRANFVGTDQFTYRQTDDQGNSADFIVSVVVTAPAATAVTPPPNAPATGSGGNLPGLPNTGAGGGEVTPWLIAALLLFGTLAGGIGLTRTVARKRSA